MLLDLIQTGNLRIAVISLLLSVPTILISLTVHEYAHGLVAAKLGDPTARSLGRLTLNPMKHLDPLGALAMLIVGFGWAKPVPINTRYFRNPKKGMALTALAGPVANFFLAILGVTAYALCYKFGVKGYVYTESGYALEYSNMFMEAAILFFYYFFMLNLTLAVFNLIPLPPFDGSRIFYALLPAKWYFGVMKYETYIMIAVLIGFATGLFSISPLVNLIADGMLKLLGKILW